MNAAVHCPGDKLTRARFLSGCSSSFMLPGTQGIRGKFEPAISSLSSDGESCYIVCRNQAVVNNESWKFAAFDRQDVVFGINAVCQLWRFSSCSWGSRSSSFSHLPLRPLAPILAFILQARASYAHSTFALLVLRTAV